jgi:hypothetical protein
MVINKMLTFVKLLPVERKIRKGRKVSSAFTLKAINNTEHKL